MEFGEGILERVGSLTASPLSDIVRRGLDVVYKRRI